MYKQKFKVKDNIISRYKHHQTYKTIINLMFLDPLWEIALRIPLFLINNNSIANMKSRLKHLNRSNNNNIDKFNIKIYKVKNKIILMNLVQLYNIKLNLSYQRIIKIISLVKKIMISMLLVRFIKMLAIH